MALSKPIQTFNFSLDISTMFSEYEFLDRYAPASALGFKAVESRFDQFEFDRQFLCKFISDVGLKHVMINSKLSQNPTEFGVVCIPNDLSHVKNLLDSVMHAEFMFCPKINIIAGLVKPRESSYTFEDHEKAFIANLKGGMHQLVEYQKIGLLKPTTDLPNYFLRSFEKTVKYIEEVDSPLLKLLLDINELAKIEGDVLEGIKKYIPYTSHIQISEEPGRLESSASSNYIDYKAVLELLSELHYDGYIGLDYFPRTSVADSIKWISDLGYTL